MSINFNELRELLGAIAQADIAEFTLKSEDFELTVRKGNPPAAAPPAASNLEAVAASLPTPSLLPPPPSAPATPEAATETLPAPTEPAPTDRKWVAITAPMVGTFYRASAPGEAPFVEVNDRIGSGQVVCIIEAMKLMNEIEAEISGQVMEIAVVNGEPVEYGQTLMWVNPG